MSKTKSAAKTAFWLVFIWWVATTSQPAQAADGLKWFRGQLHAHSYWSDGRGFPEQAIDAYKQRGYHFLSLTEHNLFAEDAETWRKVETEEGSWPPKVSQTMFDAYVQTYGTDWVETKTEGAVTTVRLKTYSEVKAKFEKPGDFILIPGVELTQSFDKRDVHLNYVNLPVVLPSIRGAGFIKNVRAPATTVSDLIALNIAETERAAIKLQDRPHLLMVNHPFWRHYEIVPQNLIDCPDVRFFELCNGGSEFAPHPRAPNYPIEKFWDVVNAFRQVQGSPLLYGVGSDDAHFYDAKRINDQSGVGDAWVMVHAASLTPTHLIEAMHQGDFYATSGVLLESVAFTPADRTLRVTVRADQGVKYRIHFITTKRGFDQTVATVSSPAEKKRPARTIPIYSDEIGKTVKTVQGVEATYQMEADDLYVRVRVESDIPSKISPHFHPKVKMAWTQPYTTGSH